MFNDELEAHPALKNTAARERVAMAMLRIPNILERQVVAHQKTLEQKISDQGPIGQRVDPHLVGLAIKELVGHRKIVRETLHAETRTMWLSNARYQDPIIQPQIDLLAPTYHFISTGQFPNLVGDSLEIVVQECLKSLREKDSRYSFFGYLNLARPLDKYGRFPKTEPPDNISGNFSKKLPDFHLFGFPSGPAIIECKNYREWLYPNNSNIRDLIIKGTDLDATPVLICRRAHYTTISNLLAPAGILVHETYNQFYPETHLELAAEVRQKRLLGFSDVLATYQPPARTLRFFNTTLPAQIERAATLFRANRSALVDYASGAINLAQLYNAIGSPAAGNWVDRFEDVPF